MAAKKKVVPKKAPVKKSGGNTRSANAAENDQSGKNLIKKYQATANILAEVGMRHEKKAPSVSKMAGEMYKKHTLKFPTTSKKYDAFEKGITIKKYEALKKDVEKLQSYATKVMGRRGR